MGSHSLLTIARRVLPFAVTAALVYVVFQYIPYQRLLTTLRTADYVRFLAWMVPNTLLFVVWDTLVVAVAVRWFHGPVRYVDLLPVRAASYIVAVVNTNAGRGALAVFLSRLLGQPALQMGSTVIFLVLTEFTHLVLWATLGILLFGADLTRPLLWVPPGVAAAWLAFFAYARARRFARASSSATSWHASLLRTFRLAPPRRYGQIVLLRMPVFLASLCFHYFAAPAFGLSIPFGHMLTFLPVVFMVAALPISVARVGTTQAAWILLFGSVAPVEQVLAFGLAANVTFALTRALTGVLLLPCAYRELLSPPAARAACVANAG